MKQVKLGTAALNQTPLDWAGNEGNIRRSIELAKAEGVGLLCLPELAVSGYGCEDHFTSPYILERSWNVLQAVLPDVEGIVVVVGLPFLHLNRVYNVVAVVANEELVGMVPKQFLASDGVHYEPRWFVPWSAGLVDEANDGTPFGDLLFDFDGVRVGVEICRDAWVGPRPGIGLSYGGGDVILNPSGSHFSFTKRGVRRRFILEASRAFGVAYAYSNLLGCESGRIIFDGDCTIASEGAIVAEAARFSFDKVVLTTAVVDIDANRRRQAIKVEVPPEIGKGSQVVFVDHALVDSTLSLTPPLPKVPNLPEREVELCDAVSLGLFDYLCKSKGRGFVVSLSGGADSAAVTSLATIALKRAWNALGQNEFGSRMVHAPEICEASTVEQVIERGVLGVYQRTKNNSQETLESARGLASGLGITFHEIEIDPMVESYAALGAKAIGRPLNWDGDDLVLQNLQSRLRAPFPWLLANARGAILLTTGNRSEASVGYMTMDGDTSGSLDPIGGVGKPLVRSFLRWLESEIPALAKVSALTPSAELRPLSAKQADEKDLMPYEVLDRIESEAVMKKRSPREVLFAVQGAFDDRFTEGEIVSWVIRFFELWPKSQWKRERLAVSFHLDDYSLDSRGWCRFPVLSGGFEEEIEELRGSLRLK